MRILVTGLPGSGKTTLARELHTQLNGSQWYNGDQVRQINNDWDFSAEGRLRQAHRMRELADANKTITIADFVAPTDEIRAIYQPHYVFFMDTIKEGRFSDTNKLYQKPKDANCIVRNQEWDEFDVAQWIAQMYNDLPAGIMIGRYQPFHDGHRALAEQVLERHPIVRVLVRAMPTSEKNPFKYPEVRDRILDAMHDYEGRVCVQRFSNVGGVYYGRDVGYNVEQIHLPPDVQAISATKIRESMTIHTAGG